MYTKAPLNVPIDPSAALIISFIETMRTGGERLSLRSESVDGRLEGLQLLAALVQVGDGLPEVAGERRREIAWR